MLCQTTCSKLITVEPKLVVVTLLCPKFIVFDICSHYLKCPGREMVGPDFFLSLEVSLG